MRLSLVEINLRRLSFVHINDLRVIEPQHAHDRGVITTHVQYTLDVLSRNHRSLRLSDRPSLYQRTRRLFDDILRQMGVSMTARPLKIKRIAIAHAHA